MLCLVTKVHQQTDCNSIIEASDSETNDVADSSDVFQYVTDSHQLPVDETQLIATTAEVMSSSSDYKVFVNGSSGEYVGSLGIPNSAKCLVLAFFTLLKFLIRELPTVIAYSVAECGNEYMHTVVAYNLTAIFEVNLD